MEELLNKIVELSKQVGKLEKDIMEINREYNLTTLMNKEIVKENNQLKERIKYLKEKCETTSIKYLVSLIPSYGINLDKNSKGEINYIHLHFDKSSLNNNDFEYLQMVCENRLEEIKERK